MSLIGTSPPRPDGLPKVNGSARYGDDFTVPGMLYGATVRSPHPRARIDGIAWHPERAPDGSVCVTAADLPGPNGVQLIDDSWPVLAAGEVRHVGEPVALVAAPTPLAALRARAAVEVSYAPLEPVLTVEEAAGRAPLYDIGLDTGGVEAALAASEVIVEGTYATGHQEHIYIECQAMTAWFEPDGTLEVVGSMQCPYYVHKSLTHGFELPDERVRIRSSAIGGGFGGKEDYPSMIAFHAALLARAAGRPVRIAYDRHEDIVGTTKRHPAVIRHRTGVDRDGRLRAMEIDVTMDGGAYATLSKVVLSRGLLHAAGAYRCPEVRARGRAIATNTATNGAFRGFGAPQTEFAIERHMDRIARVLGLDPLEIRLRNVLEAGDRLPTGQVLDDTTAARECLERVAEKTDFRRRWQECETRRSGGGTDDGAARVGLGLSLFLHGAGFTGNGERRMKAPVKVRLTADGRIEVLTAQTDMGQGCAIVFPQIACDAAGVRPQDVHFPEPDTDIVPNSGPTVASRTTMVVGGTLALAVADLRDRVLDWWRQEQGEAGPVQVAEGRVSAGERSVGLFRELAQECYAALGPLEIERQHEPPKWQSFDEDNYLGDAYPTYSWGADVVELSVDPDTHGVSVDKVTSVCDVGKAIHPILCKGQIEGGTLQAVAWGLMEELKIEDGRYLNDRLATYIIPTIKDCPRMDVELVERPWQEGPFGAKGVGEMPMDGGAPAAVAAIENATGLVITEIPATPERLLAAQQAGHTVESLAGAGSEDSDS